MPYGPQKLILIRAGRYDLAEVELHESLQIVGPNNTGKTTLINTLQFLYLDDRRHMDFGSYTPEQTRDYYLGGPYSYILFECLGARGQFVMGWRGQSKAAGGEPERFTYTGPFDAEDFLDENRQVREPKAVSARLSDRQFSLLKSALEHRELLLLPTKGDGRGQGLVALRDNDKYPQFRETLKNLLSLSTITQDQMRDRLLMVSGLPTDRVALDVRELFGEDYDRILRLKEKLMRFRAHQEEVGRVLKTAGERAIHRAELLHVWGELRRQRSAFEAAFHAAQVELAGRVTAENEALQGLQAEMSDRRSDAAVQSEGKGRVLARLEALESQAREFGDFVEDLARVGLQNLEGEIRRLHQILADAENETRERAEQKLSLYREWVTHKRRTVEHFDRALVTVLRGEFTDDELAPLARLFNFDLLEQPCGPDGIRWDRREALIEGLRDVGRRMEGDAYREGGLVVPLPPARRLVTELADPAAIRAQLEEDEEALRRWEAILRAIAEKEAHTERLSRLRQEEQQVRQRLFGWEQFRKAAAEEPRLRAELKEAERALQGVYARITELESLMEAARERRDGAERRRLAEETAHRSVLMRLSECVGPELEGLPKVPEEELPGDFEALIAIYLRRQRHANELDHRVREGLWRLESALGSDYTGPDEAETLRILREEMEALPDREEVLRRDWDHHLTHLRGVFDETLRSLADIKSTADRLNRSLATIPVSNLQALRLEVLDQTEIVGSLRKLADAEQPGLFDDSSNLEAALGGFRRKFEASPLLRYADLFTLRFTVTGEDGKPHHYHDFRQVESHGTTITIKVLFNLLVLRSLLREDAQRNLLCAVPFFLDEIHSLDAVNRRAILNTARKLGFLALTAAPESVSEVAALYFLQSQRGRIVLRQPHRIRVRTATTPP